MNKGKIKSLGGILLATFLLSSCDFTETCIYYGTFKASIDWSNVNGNASIPSVNDMSIILYPISGEGTKGAIAPEPFNSLTYQHELLIGEYDVLIYNPATYIIQNPTNSKEAQLTVSASTKNGSIKKYIMQELLPVYIAGQENIAISHEDTTKVVLQPRSYLQVLQFNITVKNRIHTKISQVSAELDGIATGKYMMSGGVNEDYATQDFIASKSLVEKDLFTQKINLLGINAAAPNLLRIELTFEDEHSVATVLDLSEKLKNFTAEKATIDIEVETGEYKTEASILDWNEVDWGEL